MKDTFSFTENIFVKENLVWCINEYWCKLITREINYPMLSVSGESYIIQKGKKDTFCPPQKTYPLHSHEIKSV